MELAKIIYIFGNDLPARFILRMLFFIVSEFESAKVRYLCEIKK